MSEIEARSFLPRFRAWLDDDARNMGLVAEFLIEKSTGGHFAFFKLLIDLVDGKPHEVSQNEGVFVSSGNLVLLDFRDQIEKRQAA